MDARVREDSRSDAELVAAAMAGDRGAFAGIYDRYADRLHDFCWSLLRDRDEAADATQDAFLVAAERLGQLRDPERLRPWLYAVARSQAFRRARARQRVAPEEAMIEQPDTAAGPERAAEQADLRELVWNAAAGLSERDRALLDLHLRQGLEGAELGEAMGIPAGHAYVLLSRLRDQVERALGALLVARLGRRDCPDLARLLAGWDGRFSPLIRKRVARHVDDCEVCGERRRAVASPLALLAAVPPLPAPAVLRDRVLERLQLTGAQAADPPDQGPGSSGPPDPPAGAFEPMATGPAAIGPGGPVAAAEGGGPGGRGAAAGRPTGGRTRRLVVTVAAAAVLAAAVGVALGWERQPAVSGPGGPGGPVVAGAATSVPAGSLPPGAGSTAATSSSTSAPSSATTATTATTAPAAAGTLAVSPAAVDLGAGRSTATLTLRNGGGQPLSWTATPSAPWLRASPASGRLDGGDRARVTLTADRAGLPEGTADGTVELAWDGPGRRVEVSMDVEHAPQVGKLSASPGQVGVTGCPSDTARVQATVEDESPLASVVLEWGGTQVPMTERSGAWFATLGPVDEPATVPWRVVAADVRGNSAAASGPPVTVVACIR
jgi:RNA polymerase sigma factor (sigma-70 family)